jgi:hypothetical protein
MYKTNYRQQSLVEKKMRGGLVGNIILHMIGKTKASIQVLNKIQGAALQMQRELQWFKVISLIPNSCHILFTINY